MQATFVSQRSILKKDNLTAILIFEKKIKLFLEKEEGIIR
jgi:hypothetical protein